MSWFNPVDGLLFFYGPHSFHNVKYFGKQEESDACFLCCIFARGVMMNKRMFNNMLCAAEKSGKIVYK